MTGCLLLKKNEEEEDEEEGRRMGYEGGWIDANLGCSLQHVYGPTIRSIL